MVGDGGGGGIDGRMGERVNIVVSNNIESKLWI